MAWWTGGAWSQPRAEHREPSMETNTPGTHASLTSATPWRPLQLPRLGGLQAQACTAIAQRAWNVPIDIGVQWQARLRPVPAADPRLGRLGGGQIIRLRWEGGVFHTRVPDALLVACAQALVPDIPLPGMPAAFAHTILEGALLGAQQALGLSGASLAMVDTLPEADPALPGFLLELRGAGIDGVMVLPLQADADGVAALARHALSRPRTGNRIDIGLIQVTLRAVVGETSLPAGLVETLQHGDAVMIDRYHPTAGRMLPLRAASRWSLMANCDDHALCSAAIWQADTLREDDAVPGQGRMTFELGRVMLPLRQLLIAAQTSIPVATLPGDALLCVFFEGRRVGQGALADIDGRPAVVLSGMVAPLHQETPVETKAHDSGWADGRRQYI